MKHYLNTLTGTRITGFAQLSRIFDFYLAGLLHRPKRLIVVDMGPTEGTHISTLGIKTEFRTR